MSGALKDRVVVITGVGPGMGRAIALDCAAAGAAVVLGARSQDGLDRVAVEVRNAGGRALAVVTDVTLQSGCNAIAKAALREFGRIDGVVNNAFMQPPLEPMLDASEETWQSSFNVNLFGGMRMAKACAPALMESDSGSIVFIGSMSARRIRANFGVYSATKAAVLNVAQSLAVELGPKGVRVNTVVPGFIYEDKLKWWFDHQAKERGIDPQQVYDEVAGENALGHIPEPSEIATAVTYLLSPAARAITGQSLDVNAGHWFA